MNCGNGETLSSRPSANVSQTTQPFRLRVLTISVSPGKGARQRRWQQPELAPGLRGRPLATRLEPGWQALPEPFRALELELELELA